MVACFLFILIVPVWALYLYYFKMEKIRKNLRCSWYVISSDGSVGWDPISRSWAIRAVIGAFASHEHSIKHGRLSAEDYAEFPKMLKIILRGLGVCSVVLILGSCILLVIGDFVGVAGCGWFLD
jgi:hypothetical protein